MAHDVFISYSSQDKTVADAVCATLENRKIRCWIAPRDVLAGQPYGESILNGINMSRIFVLVFSSDSNLSQQVLREVERAVSKGICILPFRIENVVPTKSMELFLSATHWLDALTPPLEKHLQELAAAVEALLGTQVTPKTEVELSGKIENKRAMKGNFKPVHIIAGISAVALVILAVFLIRAGTNKDLDRLATPNPTGEVLQSAMTSTAAPPLIGSTTTPTNSASPSTLPPSTLTISVLPSTPPPSTMLQGTSITFQSLGFKTASTSNLILEFTSNSPQSKGELDLHFQRFVGGYQNLVIKINGVPTYTWGHDPGEYNKVISIPSGVVNQGNNKIEISVSGVGPATIYQDSKIVLIPDLPALKPSGIVLTFNGLGFKTSSTTSTTLDFTCDYSQSKGELDLHFQRFVGGYQNLVIKINGVPTYTWGHDPGDYNKVISIPSGVVNQGNNKIEISVSGVGPATIYQDSKIILNPM